MDIRIRIASEEDAEALLSIYRYYVENTAITFECHVPSVEEFKSRIRLTLERYPYLVAEEGERIVGYAYASPFKAREAYNWSVETSIYLDRYIRGKGIGTRLYKALEDVLRQQHITGLNACIAYPEIEDEYLTRNSAQYHAHLGYRLVGEFHHCAYKFERWYNMVWMEKKLIDGNEKPQPIIWFPELQNR